MPRSRYKVVTDHAAPYFVTLSVVNWTAVFGNQVIANHIIESLEFLHKSKRLSLHAYVIMENHIHLIVSSNDLSGEIRKFKSYTARQCIDWYQSKKKRWVLKQLKSHRNHGKYGQDYQFWQEGFHPKLIQTDKMLVNKLEYIHNNPIERGYVDAPEYWKYSSYRNYMGMEAVLPVVKLY